MGRTDTSNTREKERVSLLFALFLGGHNNVPRTNAPILKHVFRYIRLPEDQGLFRSFFPNTTLTELDAGHWGEHGV